MISSFCWSLAWTFLLGGVLFGKRFFLFLVGGQTDFGTSFRAEVLVWCYLYTIVWMIFAEAPCSYWMWLIAFRMTAVSASGVGVFMSTLVPKQNSTLATAVLLLVMGGALSEPQVIAEAEGLSSALAFLSPFTWSQAGPF